MNRHEDRSIGVVRITVCNVVQRMGTNGISPSIGGAGCDRGELSVKWWQDPRGDGEGLVPRRNMSGPGAECLSHVSGICDFTDSATASSMG